MKIMDTAMTQHRNRLQAAPTSTTSSAAAIGGGGGGVVIGSNAAGGNCANAQIAANTAAAAAAVAAATANANANNNTSNLTLSQSPPPPSASASTSTTALQMPTERINSTSSFANLLDGFTARVSAGVGVGGSERSASVVSSPSSTNSLIGAGLGSGGFNSGGGSIASITSIGTLGTTANAFYSSIGQAFNSLASPISAAAAAATATTAEAAAVVVAAASAISNHLSSPTSGTPPHPDDLDDEEDCDDDDEDEDNNRHMSVPAPKKSWSEIKATVNDLRKQLSNLSSMVPTNIQFRTLSDGRVRCYFLSTPPNAWETTLLYVDIPTVEGANQHHHLNQFGLAQEQPFSSSSSSNEASSSSNSSHNSHGISMAEGFCTNSSAGVGGGGGGGGGGIGGAGGVGGSIYDSLRMPSPATSQASSPTSGGFFGGGGGGVGGGFGSQKKKLPWKIVLQQPISSVTAATSAGWSREFQLLQERKRLPTWGITSYELHKPSGKIIFPCFNDLYQCLDTGYNSSPLFPTQLRTCPQWAALDPQICPQNSDLIAYISGCDIWVTHTVSGHEERLTFAHDGRRSFADDPLSAGVPSYVMQEEFSRYQGYWWQPQSEDGIYRIVYEEVDESDVCLYTFPSSQAIPGEMEEYRFPRTGTANAKSKLKMVQFILNESLQISEVCNKDLRQPLSVVFPWLEYIVRVGWTPDSNYVWLQGLNRKQQRLDVALIPLDNFCETYSSSASSPSGCSADHSWKSPYSRSVSPIQVIYSQTTDSWINVHDLLYFLEITETTVTFVWASEETGFRHLYLVTSSLKAAAPAPSPAAATTGASTTPTAAGATTTTTAAVTSAALNGTCGSPVRAAMQHAFVDSSMLTNSTTSMQSVHMADMLSGDYIESSVTLQPRIINKVALTSGEWEVLGRNLWVDKPQQLVYFLGLRDTPLEKHLYVISLQRPEHIRLLTEPGYSFLIEFDESCQFMLQVYCNIQRLPSCKVMRITQTCQNGGVNGIHMSLVGYLHEGGKPEPQYCPQIYRPQLPSGDVVYAMVFKPHNFQLGVKYPTVLNVYGGPEVQTVNNTFKGKHQLRMHMLAAQGYCVICIDSRGSRHRGLKFESHIRCRMGQVELNDQVDALRILADQLGYIDMNRIAIHGWSYGGYLSLMGLVQYPDIFKVAIAGAPVTNWEYYDTGYTERYMDLPQNNPSGYTAGSVLHYIHAFPEEDNRLLLIHGLVDENVHFDHTSQLIKALNRANKPYNLHVFPDERHSLRNVESNKNYETKLLSFLQHL